MRTVVMMAAVMMAAVKRAVLMHAIARQQRIIGRRNIVRLIRPAASSNERERGEKCKRTR
jgi:hypothetical protein